VLCVRRLRDYAAKGDYDFDVRHLEPRGVGTLYLAFEQLKKRLQAEGLFDSAHKKPLPRFPHTIAVVTSPQGAAVRDIIRTIQNRFPKVRILLYGVQVQGAGAAGEIARALDILNQRDDISVIIIGRGGGSLEDLWAFNEECVARAIYRSRVPVVSAVGHEVDYTISDFVADVRAPTPTGAGQLVVPDLNEVLRNLNMHVRRCFISLRHILMRQKEALRSAAKSPVFADPFSRLHDLQRTLDDIWRHIRKDILSAIQRKKENLSLLGERLNASSPLAILKRGYSITTLAGEKSPLKDPKDAPPGTLIETRLLKGKLLSKTLPDQTTPPLF
ncbi:MAG: exodeoxyribonuclease VII large subunit, partial [Planctomycetota bacterium]|nr:exodeoxyribonuclease VII large subunit [Planctomycetota bacterium]